PNPKGISNNYYLDFNVNTKGLILNNSIQSITPTQLGGFIGSNPNLLQQEASFILNQVTSTRSSQLLGTIEIAGGRAGLLIANPNGITCRGCGFINVSSLSLATGLIDAQEIRHLQDLSMSNLSNLSDGISQRVLPDSLDENLALRIQRGHINIDSLNASNIASVNILAKSLSIAQHLYANHLNIILGSSKVSLDTKGALLLWQPLKQEGIPSSKLALDVAYLGGAWAQSIYLVASDLDTKIQNFGIMATFPSTKDGDGGFYIDGRGHLEIAGASKPISLDTYERRSSLESNDFNDPPSPSMPDKTSDKSLISGEFIGGFYAFGNLDIQAKSLHNTSFLKANKNLSVSVDSLFENQGILMAKEDLNIISKYFNNTQALLEAKNISLMVERIKNENNALILGNTISMQAKEFSNEYGFIYAKENLNIHADTLRNIAYVSTQRELISQEHIKIGDWGNYERNRYKRRPSASRYLKDGDKDFDRFIYQDKLDTATYRPSAIGSGGILSLHAQAMENQNGILFAPVSVLDIQNIQNTLPEAKEVTIDKGREAKYYQYKYTYDTCNWQPFCFSNTKKNYYQKFFKIFDDYYRSSILDKELRFPSLEDIFSHSLSNRFVRIKPYENPLLLAQDTQSALALQPIDSQENNPKNAIKDVILENTTLPPNYFEAEFISSSTILELSSSPETSPEDNNSGNPQINKINTVANVKNQSLQPLIFETLSFYPYENVDIYRNHPLLVSFNENKNKIIHRGDFLNSHYLQEHFVSRTQEAQKVFLDHLGIQTSDFYHSSYFKDILGINLLNQRLSEYDKSHLANKQALQNTTQEIIFFDNFLAKGQAKGILATKLDVFSYSFENNSFIQAKNAFIYSKDILSNRGLIKASDLRLSSDGKLSHSGDIASENLTLEAKNISVFSSMYSTEEPSESASYIRKKKDFSKVAGLKGKDISITAKESIDMGHVNIHAKNHLGITGQRISSDTQESSNFYEDTYKKETFKINLGANLQGESIELKAGDSLWLTQTSLKAYRDVVLSSLGEIYLQASEDSSQADYEYFTQEEGFFVSKEIHESYELGSFEQKGNTFVGENIFVQARGSIFSEGSNFQASKDLDISTQKDYLHTALSHKQYFSSRRTQNESILGFEFGKNKDAHKTSSLKHVHSQLSAHNISIHSGGNLTLPGASLHAETQMQLHSQGNIIIGSAQDRLTQEASSSEKSWFGLLDHQQGHTQKEIAQFSSHLSAKKLHIQAKQNVNILASNMDISEDASILAKGNIYILSASNSKRTSSFESKRDFDGVDLEFKRKFSLGASYAISQSNDNSNQTQAIGSHLNVLGNLTLQAGQAQDSFGMTQANRINQTNPSHIIIEGSSIDAGKDINLLADNTNILGARNETSHSKDALKGELRVSLDIGNAYVDTYFTAQDLAQASKNIKKQTQNLNQIQKLYEQGLASEQALEEAKYNLVFSLGNVESATLGLSSSLASIASTAATGFYASISTRISAHDSHTQEKITTFSPSVLKAGGNIFLQARDSITQIGSSAIAKGKLSYQANHHISLLSSTNTYESTTKSQYTSSQTSYGGNGFVLNVSKGGNEEVFEKSSQNNTQLSASGISLLTPGDIRLEGSNLDSQNAQIQAKNLSIASRLDMTYTHTKEGGWGVGYGSGNIQGDISTSQSKQDALFFNQLSGIHTANHLFVTIQEKTNLEGGYLFSDSKQLKLSTNTLSYQDINTKDIKGAKGFHIGISTPQDNLAHSHTQIGLSHQGHQSEGRALATLGEGEIEIKTLNYQETQNPLPLQPSNQSNRFNNINDTQNISKINFSVDSPKTFFGSAVNMLSVIKNPSHLNPLSSINRDIHQLSIVSKNQITGVLQGHLDIDNRIFSQNGRKEILENISSLPSNTAKAINATNTTFIINPIVSTYTILSNPNLKLTDLPTQYQANQQVMATINQLNQDTLNQLPKGQDITQITQALPQNRRESTYLYYNPEDKLTGFYDTKNHHIYLNGAYDTFNDTRTFITTLGHEITHQLTSKEAIAQNAGNYATFSYGLLNALDFKPLPRQNQSHNEGNLTHFSNPDGFGNSNNSTQPITSLQWYENQSQNIGFDAYGANKPDFNSILEQNAKLAFGVKQEDREERTILVHGTSSDPITAFSPIFRQSLAQAFDDPNQEDFAWSGNNDDASRRKAAGDLLNQINQPYEYAPNEPLIIVTHSHGGNVAKIMSNLYDYNTGKKPLIINIATPNRKDYVMNPHVEEFYNVYNVHDTAVQGYFGGIDKTFPYVHFPLPSQLANEPNGINVKIDQDYPYKLYMLKNPSKYLAPNHTEFKNPTTIKILKKAIDERKKK
ncbi:hemagglutinin repeat-containing protein, partial [Helicobacter sp. 11S03491-1]|uniref:hemagglutinin repeat-containing protein n=1 Tax=Helicobacter sp. 11S03491-1 TaxID=1476196 RepID=UPI00117BBA9C